MEHKHCHILQVAQALKCQPHLPPHLWGECVLTAVHLINRLPSPLISYKSPFELLHSKPPSVSHLRVFGYLAYATNVHPTHKFDSRAVQSTFIGYPIGQKAYKLYDLSTRQVFTSRDVKFHKNIFPYAPKKPSPLLSQQSGPIPCLTPADVSFESPTSNIRSPSFSHPENQHILFSFLAANPPSPSLRTYSRRPPPTTAQPNPQSPAPSSQLDLQTDPQPNP